MLNQENAVENMNSQAGFRPQILDYPLEPWGGSGCSCCCCKCPDDDGWQQYKDLSHTEDATLSSADIPEDAGTDAGFDAVDFIV